MMHEYAASYIMDDASRCSSTREASSSMIDSASSFTEWMQLHKDLLWKYVANVSTQSRNPDSFLDPAPFPETADEAYDAEMERKRESSDDDDGLLNLVPAERRMMSVKT